MRIGVVAIPLALAMTAAIETVVLGLVLLLKLQRRPRTAAVRAEPPDGTLFTHAECAPFDTSHGLTQYPLAVKDDAYQLSSDGRPILSGPLRDYTAFEGPVNPYRTPNFVFLGDDTGSALAIIRLRYVSMTAIHPVPSGA